MSAEMKPIKMFEKRLNEKLNWFLELKNQQTGNIFQLNIFFNFREKIGFINVSCQKVYVKIKKNGFYQIEFTHFQLMEKL